MLAAWALEKIGDTAAIPALQDAAAFDTVYLVRAAALKALEKIARENNIQAVFLFLGYRENGDSGPVRMSPEIDVRFR